MENIVSAVPANIPSPALGWFRKVVAALNHHNAVSDASLLASKKAGAIAPAEKHPFVLSPSTPSSPALAAAACCAQNSNCLHAAAAAAANYNARLAAMAVTGSSFIAPPSRVHANVNITAPASYWDYERTSLESLRCEANRYKRNENCIGSGRYSQVFVASDTHNAESACVIKLIRPGKAKRIRREVLILKNLQGGPGIIDFHGFQTDRETSQPALVFRALSTPANWREMFNAFSSKEVKGYMYQLVRALAYAHSKGVMHRDVKPQNVLYDPATKELRLIDWGLAEFYFPYQKYSTRVASRFFKSPEILLGYGAYDYSLDIWSAGCVFAGMIFRVPVFFRGEDDIDQLNKIAQVLGTDDLRVYIRKFDMQQQCDLSPDVDELLADLKYPAVPFTSFVTEDNFHLATPDALDLLQLMLVYNHIDRATATEVLAHKYFDEVRNSFK